MISARQYKFLIRDNDLSWPGVDFFDKFGLPGCQRGNKEADANDSNETFHNFCLG